MKQEFDFHQIKDEVFAQLQNKKLQDFTEKEWQFHRDVIESTFQGGWDNSKYPWRRDMQDFWRYPLSFSTYAIPSLVMIDESKYEEAADCLRKSILLFKDTPVWDGWVRKGQGPDPICCQNIMYKGHLNLYYGLYQLMTGSTEFEKQFKQLTKIITDEYQKNFEQRNFWGIECEDDQYFPPCNSQGILSTMVYDKVFGTDYYQQYGKKVAEFIGVKVSDPDTKMVLLKYHPSHDQAEAYIAGSANSWTLTQIHISNKEQCEEAYRNFKKMLIHKYDHNSSYLKECTYAEEPAMGLEESLGMLYVPGLAKEFNDPDLWAEAMNYITKTNGMELLENAYRLKDITVPEEVYIKCYMLWGSLHTGWENIMNYDWAGVRERNGGAQDVQPTE